MLIFGRYLTWRIQFEAPNAFWVKSVEGIHKPKIISISRTGGSFGCWRLEYLKNWKKYSSFFSIFTQDSMSLFLEALYLISLFLEALYLISTKGQVLKGGGVKKRLRTTGVNLLKHYMTHISRERLRQKRKARIALWRKFTFDFVAVFQQHVKLVAERPLAMTTLLTLINQLTATSPRDVVLPPKCSAK